MRFDKGVKRHVVTSPQACVTIGPDSASHNDDVFPGIQAQVTRGTDGARVADDVALHRGDILDTAFSGPQRHIAARDSASRVGDVAKGRHLKRFFTTDGAARIGQRRNIHLHIRARYHRARHYRQARGRCQVNNGCQNTLACHRGFNHPDNVGLEVGNLVRRQRLAKNQACVFALVSGLVHQALHLVGLVAIASQNIVASLRNQLLAHQKRFVVGITQAFERAVWVNAQSF